MKACNHCGRLFEFQGEGKPTPPDALTCKCDASRRGPTTEKVSAIYHFIKKRIQLGTARNTIGELQQILKFIGDRYPMHIKAELKETVKYPTEEELRATEAPNAVKLIYVEKGCHTHVRVFMNGGLCGYLTFRNDEFKIVMKRLVGTDGFEFIEEPS